MLTASEREQFETLGYLVIDPEIPEAVLDAAVAETLPMYGTSSLPQTGGRVRNRIQDAWQSSPAVKQIATAPKVLAILEELYGRRALPFQTLNFPKGTEQPCHSDTIHFNAMPEGFMTGVWVALEEIGPEQGPLVYYPGSQQFPEYTMQDFGLQPSDQDYPAYERELERIIAGLVERGVLVREYGTLRKGQALLWAANLWHGGSFQQDKERTRHSQVTHYFYEGCRYYTPMFSTPEAPFWRQPHWIR